MVTAAIAAAQEGQPALEHPAIEEVLAMADADASPELITARVEQIEEFPVLDGRQLAELKRRGVPDAALLVMLARATPAVRSPTTAPTGAQPRAAASIIVPEGAGLVRVTVERPFPVTFLEVVLDGGVVHSEGRLWEGAVDPGGMLPRPFELRGPEPLVAYASPVVPGRHELAIGFAVTVVDQDRGAQWGGQVGEHYTSRGTRATGEALSGEAPAGNPPAVCELAAGEVCEVVATLQRSSPSVLGSGPYYSVWYRVQTGPLP